MSREKLLTILVVISGLHVEGELGFDVIRQQHALDYLQYIGLIPESVKCIQWGYKRSHVDLFKLEIVCLKELAVHRGICPVWQDCQWYRYYSYFPRTCLRDNDCDSTCKCCYSPCFGTLTCRPAVRQDILSTPNLSTTTSGTPPKMTTTTTSPDPDLEHLTEEYPTVTTDITMTDVQSPNYDDSGDNVGEPDDPQITTEIDENSESQESNTGPNILHESEYDDSMDQDVDNGSKSTIKSELVLTTTVSKSEESQIEPDRGFANISTTEPSLIRPEVPIASGSQESNLAVVVEADEESDTEEIIDVGSPGDDQIHFEATDANVFLTDDEDFAEGSGSGSGRGQDDAE